MSKTRDIQQIQLFFQTEDFNNQTVDINKFKEKFKNKNDFDELNYLKQIHKYLIIGGCILLTLAIWIVLSHYLGI